MERSLSAAAPRCKHEATCRACPGRAVFGDQTRIGKQENATIRDRLDGAVFDMSRQSMRNPA